MKFFAMVRLAGVLLLASSLPITFGCVRVVRNVVNPDEDETQDNTSNDTTTQPQPQK